MSSDIKSAIHQGQTVIYYRKLKKMSRAKLAELLGVDVSTVYRMEQQSVIKDFKRRQLLVGLLGIPATLMGLDADSHIPFLTDPALNEDHMAFFEHELATRWDIYQTGGTTRASRGLIMWLREVTRFAQEAKGSAWHERATATLMMSYQLQGSIYRDLMQYEHAHAAYHQAFLLAQEHNDLELMASALARRGVTCIQQHRPIQATEYLRTALQRVDRLGMPCLRGYILQALSEAYAMAQQPQACWRNTELAERALERKGLVQERSNCQLNTTSVIAQKGINALLLHDNERAVVLIEKGMLSYDPTLIRGRARLIAQKAEAYYGLGELDACVETAEEALKLARSIGSSKTRMRVEQLHGRLSQSSWRKESNVIRLGTLLV